MNPPVPNDNCPAYPVSRLSPRAANEKIRNGIRIASNQYTFAINRITTKENPIVNSVIFEGEKAKKHIEAIKEYITLRENTSFIENYIKSDINLIKEFYRQLGFYFVKIDADIEKLKRRETIYKT